MKKLFVLLLVSLLCFSLTACGDSNGSSSNDTESSGAIITVALGGEGQPLDPANGNDAITSTVKAHLFYPLFSFNEDGSLVNELCTSYEVSEDGLVYTLHLQEGVMWSDGIEITADQVEYAIKRSVGMGMGDAYYSYYIVNTVKNAQKHSDAMSAVADMDDLGVTTIDDYTLEITLEAPCAYFPSLMTAGVFTPVREDFAPEKDYTWSLTPGFPVSGAFTVTEIDTSIGFTLEKNESFIQADEVSISGINFIVMSDASAQLIAFQSGQIDVATLVSSDVTKIYEDQPELIITPSIINFTLRINTSDETLNPALLDVNVRRALQLGIDRTNVVTAIDAGDLYYELYGHVPEGFAGIDGDFRLEQDASDPLVYTDKDEARALMEAAGYSEDNRLQLEYYYNQTTVNDVIAQVLQAEYAEIYVDLTLATKETQMFFDDRDNGFYEICRSAMSADYMDPTTYLNMALTYSQPVVAWGNETYDQMLADAELIVDPTERLQALHDAEEYLVRTDPQVIPLVGYKQINLQQSNITGTRYSPQGNGLYSFCTVE